jgi:hypothetical protein
VLARAQVSAGDNDGAIATVRRAVASVDLSRTWHARMLAMLPMFEHTNAADLDSLDAIARRALAIAEEVGDAFATANALTDLWLSHGVRRDHAAALEYIDRALRVLAPVPGFTVNSVLSTVLSTIRVLPSGVAAMPFRLRPAVEKAATGRLSGMVTARPKRPKGPIGISYMSGL